MSFSEKIKFEVKKKSHQTCCVCKQIGIEIHHIIPQCEGGPDTEDNAAPLCPSCHEIYGANPTKRKFIKESKEIWLEICSEKFSNDSLIITKLSDRIKFIESHLGIKAERIYSSLEESQNHDQRTTGEQISFVEGLRRLLIIESPSIEDTDEFMNFHVTYLLVFETGGEKSEENKRFNFVRKKFLSMFGRYIAEKIVLHQMKVYEINWMKGILEPTLNVFLTACKIFMISMLRHSGFEKKDSSNGLDFTPQEQAIVDSLLLENNSR